MTPSQESRPAGRAPETESAASRALTEALRGSFRLLKLTMALVALMFLGSGAFIVKAHERAFVLRFGRIVTDEDGTAIRGPGLHISWPFLIDEVIRFPVQRMLGQRISIFWYREQSRGAKEIMTLRPGEGRMTLTGDANVLHSSWRIRYRIEDPVKFCQRLADPAALAAGEPVGPVAELMELQARNAILRTMAEFPVDEAYRHRKADLGLKVRERLVAQIAALDVGIQVHDVILDFVVPPRETKDAFDDVLRAEVENKELREKADAYKEETINKAKGMASRLVAEARAYRTRIVQQAAADAEYISNLIAEYPQDPEMLRLFLERRLEEVREEVLAACEERFIIKEGTGRGKREIRVMINRDQETLREREREKLAP